MQHLIDSDVDGAAPLCPGAMLLRGFALPVDHALVAGVHAVIAQAPLRQMTTPGGLQMSVQDGVLMGWTLDLATARKLGMESTANASRGPSAPPSPSTSSA